MSILPRCPKCWKMYCTGSHTGLCDEDKRTSAGHEPLDNVPFTVAELVTASNNRSGQTDANGHVDPVGGCPCLYTTPCDPRCTCVNNFSSTGCLRCCAYGSIEQRKNKAILLALDIDNFQELQDKYFELSRAYHELRSKLGDK